jgi:hypothetical protein
MWAIDNQTPFAAERTFVRDRDGAEIWLVAVRATFDLFPDGSLQPAAEQLPVAKFPEYLGKPGASSLRWDSDLPRTKVGTDILLNATAHVPERSADLTQLEVGFRVGELFKRLSVHGDRVWERTLGVLVPSRPKPFRTMPIVYERAFGGSVGQSAPTSSFAYSQRNPLGIGLENRIDGSLPNIAHLGASAEKPYADRIVPGFGAIGCSWSPRRELAGTYDQAWKQTRQPLVPGDFDDRHFQAAPADQVANGFLAGGEAVTLTHLTPGGETHFRLPRLSFGFRTSIGGSVQHHRGNLHTVILEPDAGRLVMVWQTALPCHHTLYTLTRTVIFEKRRIDRREAAA